MEPSIIVAIITGLFSLVCTVTGVVVSNSKTLYRIEQLEKKVEKHNNVIERTYDLEKKDDHIELEVNHLKERVDKLEKDHH